MTQPSASVHCIYVLASVGGRERVNWPTNGGAAIAGSKLARDFCPASLPRTREIL
ncbi:MAG: hypothetical protein OXG08_06080 [Gammaproteobacteria bacterium]|nr:hypothetical protein [Gammaproteobacteria bacterium]